MSRIKLGLSGLNAVEVNVKANHVLGLMTGNPNFPTPLPPLATLETATDELAAAIEAALNGGHQAVSVRNEKADVVKGVLRAMAGYIQAASDGVATVITSSGFEVVAQRVPVGIPSRVENVTAATSEYPGCASLKWKSLKEKADSYSIYCTQQDPSGPNVQWMLIGQCTKASFVAENLPNHNQYYWFAVVALNAAGVSAMSDPAMAMVL